MPRLSPRASALVALFVTAIFSSPAFASGISVARFGGAHGNVTSTNPSTLYYNPAGFAGHGTQVMLDLNLALRTASYERFEGDIDPIPDSVADPAAYAAANTGEANLTNLVYAPMLGVTTDFGTGMPFAVGAAFFAPFGGQSVWDTDQANDLYPGAEDGAQRWYVMEGTIRTLAIALGVAYKIESLRLSFGLSGNVYLSEIDTARARTATGEDTLLNEGRSYLKSESTDFGLGFGVLAEPIEGRLWLGASYQSAPNFNGELEMDGTLQNIFPPNYEDPTDIVITNQLPDIIRLGARWRPREDLELRLFGDYTRWSKLEQQCIMATEQIDVVNERRAEDGLGSLDPYELCNVDEGGETTTEGVDRAIIQNIIRRWQDAAGFRLGVSYWLNEKVELQFDLGYDGNAVPDESLEPALQDYNDVSIGLGGRFQLADFFHLSVLATEIIYFERDTRGTQTANRFGAPSRQPPSAGVYNQNIFVFNTNLEFGF